MLNFSSFSLNFYLKNIKRGNKRFFFNNFLNTCTKNIKKDIRTIISFSYGILLKMNDKKKKIHLSNTHNLCMRNLRKGNIIFFMNIPQFVLEKSVKCDTLIFLSNSLKFYFKIIRKKIKEFYKLFLMIAK